MATGTAMDSSYSSTNSRNTILPLLVLLMTTTALFSSAPPVAGEPPDIVPFACKYAVGAGGGTVTEAFCLSTLLGKNSAGAADFADLAVITVDLTTANATATEAKIGALLAGKNSAATSQGLQSCRALYSTVVRQYQPASRAAVKGGRYADGKASLGRTAQAAKACEREFRHRMVVSPVAKEDNDLAKLANLASALASISK